MITVIFEIHNKLKWQANLFLYYRSVNQNCVNGWTNQHQPIWNPGKAFSLL